MEKFDKILELLDKTTISDEEQKFINESVKSDDEVKKLVNVYKSLQSSLPNSLHLDINIIASYILYENGEEPEIKSVSLLAEKIRQHLSKCKLCRDEYDNLRQEFLITDKHIKASINEKNQSEKIQTPVWAVFKNSNVFRYAFATVAVLLMLYSGLFIYSNSNLKFYEKDLFNQGSEEVYSTRGRTSLIFQKGLDAVEHGDYETAEKYFKDDIKENINDKSIFYTYYILGITQLHTAEKSFLGLFPTYDKKIVDEAIASFNKAIELNTTGNYVNINLDAFYYLGRAYLLEDDFKNAKHYLDIVTDKKGRFYNEAKELIETIEYGN